MEVISKTGQITTAISGKRQSDQQKPGKDSILKAPELVPDTAGASLTIEPVVGPDGWTLDATVSFIYQGTTDGGKTPLSIRFDGTTTLWDNYPQILQLVEATGDTPAYALILRVTIALPSTWPVREAQQRN